MLITCRYITIETPVKVRTPIKYDNIFGLSSYSIKDFLKNIKAKPLFSPKLNCNLGLNNINISTNNDKLNNSKKEIQELLENNNNKSINCTHNKLKSRNNSKRSLSISTKFNEKYRGDSLHSLLSKDSETNKLTTSITSIENKKTKSRQEMYESQFGRLLSNNWLTSSESIGEKQSTKRNSNEKLKDKRLNLKNMSMSRQYFCSNIDDDYNIICNMKKLIGIKEQNEESNLNKTDVTKRNECFKNKPSTTLRNMRIQLINISSV